jgi:hypothetical protein
MRIVSSALRVAELRVQSWLGPQDLARILRQAYDPSAYCDADAISDLAVAGPVGIVEYWDHFVSDESGHSAVLWISEWPRTEVPPSFLHPLILKSGIQKTFSLVARPIGTREAIRSIRRQKVDYITDAQQKARIGQLRDFTDNQEYEDLLQREREIAAGHTDMIFTGFIAVTAASKDELDAAVAEVQRAATQCGCETRRLVGQQTQAFLAAALPLGRGL